MKIQKRTNDILKKLKEAHFIVSTTIWQHNTIAPKLYCLRKTHKQNLSLRPVVSNVNSPGYNISKFVSNILNSVNSTSDFNIKNSYELTETLKSVKVPKDFVLISLDVNSLFTNIPKNLVL